VSRAVLPAVRFASIAGILLHRRELPHRATNHRSVAAGGAHDCVDQCSQSDLLDAFEQATQLRKLPESTPPLPNEP